jgi:hypothetical protein
MVEVVETVVVKQAEEEAVGAPVEPVVRVEEALLLKTEVPNTSNIV